MAEKYRPAAVAALAFAAFLLGACGPTTPMWGPNSIRDGTGAPVDPIYGTPIPGYPLTNGRD